MTETPQQKTCNHWFITQQTPDNKWVITCQHCGIYVAPPTAETN